MISSVKSLTPQLPVVSNTAAQTDEQRASKTLQLFSSQSLWAVFSGKKDELLGKKILCCWKARVVFHSDAEIVKLLYDEMVLWYFVLHQHTVHSWDSHRLKAVTVKSLTDWCDGGWQQPRPLIKYSSAESVSALSWTRLSVLQLRPAYKNTEHDATGNYLPFADDLVVPALLLFSQGQVTLLLRCIRKSEAWLIRTELNTESHCSWLIPGMRDAVGINMLLTAERGWRMQHGGRWWYLNKVFTVMLQTVERRLGS